MGQLPRRGNSFSRAIGRGLLRVLGWRLVGDVPRVPKIVAIAAPHTSNWDFVLGMSAIFALGVRVNWLGKHTLFHWPLGAFMRWLGGVPVMRSTSDGVVSQMVQEIDRHERYIFGLSPEGTRKRVQRWKSGFYHVAHQAGVPILLAYFDYSSRTIGLGPLFEPTGDYAKDMIEIRAFYDDKVAKKPGQF